MLMQNSSDSHLIKPLSQWIINEKGNPANLPATQCQITDGVGADPLEISNGLALSPAIRIQAAKAGS